MSTTTQPNCCDSNTNCSQAMTYKPAADVIEYGDHYEMTLDVPGVDREHLDVTLEKGVLQIEGTAEYQVPEGYQPLHNPPATRKYVRSFKLSEDISQEGIEVEVKNGVVRFHLPKSTPAQKVKLEVK